MGAACAIHLILPTNIRHKCFKGVIAERIKTSSQIRISKVQLVCIEEDAHTWEPISEETVLEQECDLLSGRPAKLVGRVPVSWFELTFKYSRVVKRPSSVGIVPINWFEYKFNHSKLLKSPSSVGIVPFRSLSERRSSSVMIRVCKRENQ